MSKLWSRPSDASEGAPSGHATGASQPAASTLESLVDRVQSFTADADREQDMLLAEWDIIGSIAHVRMLGATGILPAEEVERLLPELQALLEQARSGDLRIEDDVEDIHSQVELLLTRRLGETGKRIHAARSRNDQVLTDLKLWMRHALVELTNEVETLATRLLTLSERHRDDLLPGYTHLQVAMPSSFGLWFGSWAECLAEDLWSVHAAMKVVNRNPLGSAAGYGSSFPIDREATSRDLGFDGPVWNSVAAQLGRGRSERAAANAVAAVAATLGRMSHDLVLYQSQNFGFVGFPSELTTGSSIMPHKKNPDVFELIRGRCNRLQALPNEIALVLANLPSGYHRDYQLIKERLFPAFADLMSCLSMACAMLEHIRVTPDPLRHPMYQTLFTVEAVQENVRQGMAFRDAYHQVAEQVADGAFTWDKPLQHKHQGSIGNLCNDRILAYLRNTASQVRAASGPSSD